MIIDWFTVVAQLINFLVLVVLLKHFLYQPILNAIDKREKRIADELANAKAIGSVAAQAQVELAQKTADLAQSRAQLLDKAISEAKIERQRLIDAAREEADALRAQWQQGLVSDYHNLNRDMMDKMQHEVFAITRQLLTELADANLETQMLTLFVQRLKSLDGSEVSQLVTAFNSTDKGLTVRSRYELNAEQQSTIESALRQHLSLTQPIHFLFSADLMNGIELTTTHYRLGWSSTDYLARLQAMMTQLSQQPEKVASVVAQEQPNNEQSS